MLASDPDFLVLSYTRTMMAFLLFNSEPKRIAVLGLGGGSITTSHGGTLTAQSTVGSGTSMLVRLRTSAVNGE